MHSETTDTKIRTIRLVRFIKQTAPLLDEEETKPIRVPVELRDDDETPTVAIFAYREHKS